MTREDKKAMLARKTTFIKKMPKYTSCKSAYKQGFRDALEYINLKTKQNEQISN
jgi:hypothetical protein